MDFGLISSTDYTVGKVTSALEKRKRKKKRKTSKMSSLGRVTRRLLGKDDLKLKTNNTRERTKFYAGCQPTTILLLFPALDQLLYPKIHRRKSYTEANIKLKSFSRKIISNGRSPQPNFNEKIKNDKGSDFGPCFITGMLGNFYEKLFPSNVSHSIFNGVHHLAIPGVFL
ncbi:hypothetical protein OIU84_009296 [Salix udensis]|uniref:Uncharacterized protein n=1 Tax=Salix udensis TaxID=889485 RepID=A0AAD6JRT5_9ROSI|nr:hypothetical protein OIU84_009296 [Salix udensis]